MRARGPGHPEDRVCVVPVEPTASGNGTGTHGHDRPHSVLEGGREALWVGALGIAFLLIVALLIAFLASGITRADDDVLGRALSVATVAPLDEAARDESTLVRAQRPGPVAS